MVIVQAYVLGDRLLVPGFRRPVNKFLVYIIEDKEERIFIYPPYKMATWAFDNIPVERPVLQYMVDSVPKGRFEPIDGGDDATATMVDLKDQLPRTFLHRVAKGLSLTRSATRISLDSPSLVDVNEISLMSTLLPSIAHR
ncbi:hypothetical protein K458DRAFT_396149 [Lentithecium fluviatile CBS 122367]|uniref:Uncharacterized protein n=1 Tax=Lentithecium fluviatile CBS 122367 TaxID=1168545 RepID=A0A6G1IGJ7_9PLEO|nr:hypothetical protein K458DRAFT_396149 [Lentithecium fluviatile CBS 122367]